MRRSRIPALSGTLLSMAVLAASASLTLAQVDVELAFDPAEVCPGDDVTFYVSIENLGTEPSAIDLETTIYLDEQPLFTFPAQTHLGAGEMRAHEIPFWVPPPVPPLVLGIEVTATDAFGNSDTSLAALTVLDCGAGFTGPPESALAESIASAMKDAGLYSPTDPDGGQTTWGQVKNLYNR